MRRVAGSLIVVLLLALTMTVLAAPANAGVCDGWYRAYYNCPTSDSRAAVEYALIADQ